VSTVADFECQLATFNIKSFLADYSIKAPPVESPAFVFDKKFLGANDSDMFMTLTAWKDKYLKNYSGELLLQMDIEGAEYEVFLSTPPEILDTFRIIVVEFHYLEKMFDPIVFTFFRATFEKILKNFRVVHLHPNNRTGIVRKGELEVPMTIEITFYNNRRITGGRPVRNFPHPLDRENAPNLKPLSLPECWYISE